MQIAVLVKGTEEKCGGVDAESTFQFRGRDSEGRGSEEVAKVESGARAEGRRTWPARAWAYLLRKARPLWVVVYVGSSWIDA